MVLPFPPFNFNISHIQYNNFRTSPYMLYNNANNYSYIPDITP